MSCTVNEESENLPRNIYFKIINHGVTYPTVQAVNWASLFFCRLSCSTFSR